MLENYPDPRFRPAGLKLYGGRFSVTTFYESIKVSKIRGT